VTLLAYNGLRIDEALSADSGDYTHQRGHRVSEPRGDLSTSARSVTGTTDMVARLEAPDDKPGSTTPPE